MTSAVSQSKTESSQLCCVYFCIFCTCVAKYILYFFGACVIVPSFIKKKKVKF